MNVSPEIGRVGVRLLLGIQLWKATVDCIHHFAASHGTCLCARAERAKVVRLSARSRSIAERRGSVRKL